MNKNYNNPPFISIQNVEKRFMKIQGMKALIAINIGNNKHQR